MFRQQGSYFDEFRDGTSGKGGASTGAIKRELSHPRAGGSDFRESDSDPVFIEGDRVSRLSASPVIELEPQTPEIAHPSRLAGKGIFGLQLAKRVAEMLNFIPTEPKNNIQEKAPKEFIVTQEEVEYLRNMSGLVRQRYWIFPENFIGYLGEMGWLGLSCSEIVSRMGQEHRRGLRENEGDNPSLQHQQSFDMIKRLPEIQAFYNDPRNLSIDALMSLPNWQIPDLDGKRIALALWRYYGCERLFDIAIICGPDVGAIRLKDETRDIPHLLTCIERLHGLARASLGEIENEEVFPLLDDDYLGPRITDTHRVGILTHTIQKTIQVTIGPDGKVAYVDQERLIGLKKWELVKEKR